MTDSVQVRHDHLPALPLPLHRVPGQDPGARPQQDRPGAARAVRRLEGVLPTEVPTGLVQITYLWILPAEISTGLVQGSYCPFHLK